MKSKRRRNRIRYGIQKEMREHYQSLFQTSVSELKFANLQIEFLLNSLSEIESFTNDNLAKNVIRNTKERHNLDKLIHGRNLFPQED